MDTLTDLWGCWFLQNYSKITLCEMYRGDGQRDRVTDTHRGEDAEIERHRGGGRERTETETETDRENPYGVLNRALPY